MCVRDGFTAEGLPECLRMLKKTRISLYKKSPLAGRVTVLRQAEPCPFSCWPCEGQRVLAVPPFTVL